MSSNTTEKGKSKAGAVEVPLKDARKHDITGEQPEGETTDGETTEVEEVEETLTNGLNESTDAPKKKPKRRRPRRKSKNKGKSKDVGSEAGEGSSGPPEADAQNSLLPDEFPFQESISAMPVEQRIEKLQELQEFMEDLRDKVAADVVKLREQVLLEAAETFLEKLAAVGI